MSGPKKVKGIVDATHAKTIGEVLQKYGFDFLFEKNEKLNK